MIAMDMIPRPAQVGPPRAASGLCLMLLAVVLLGAPSAPAGTFYITDTADTTAPTSLRGAILEASRHGTHSTIYLGQPPGNARGKARPVPWVFHLTLPGDPTPVELGSAFNIMQGELTIIGAVSNVVIDATGTGNRVFRIYSNAKLTLENVTIKGGLPLIYYYPSGYYPTPPGVIAGDGGGIYNAGTLVLNNCSIRGNSSANYYFNDYWTRSGNGGGICNFGSLLMNNCQITANTCADGQNFGSLADGGSGGGVYNSGTLVMANCLVASNSCGGGGGGGDSVGFGAGGNGGSGGGIFNSGLTQVADCTIACNQTGNGGSGFIGGTGGDGGAGGDGAGICNMGELNLNTCTVSENVCRAGGSGGMGYFSGSGGAGGDGGSGGGIYNDGTLAAASCTIVNNLAGAGANGGNSELPISAGYYENPPIYSVPPAAASGGAGGSGGGILNDATNTAVSVRNTLLALNEANDPGLSGTNFFYGWEGETIETVIGADGAPGSGPDVGGAVTSAGFNLIGAADGSLGFTNRLHADQAGSVALSINPLLGPLQLNGGPTPTHALLSGSPAINQGNSFGIHVDQRGHHRPYKYPGIGFAPGGDGSDIGAFELDTSAPEIRK